MYLFVDLETTGLDPQRDVILEAAFAVVGDDFGIVDSRNYIFPWNGRAEDRIHLDQNEIPLAMHTENHLIAECMRLTAEGNSFSYAFYRTVLAFELLKWFSQCGLPPHTLEMAGSGVHFDRTFLKEYLPDVESWFHYRNWDTSTLKRAAKNWSPAWYDRHKNIFEAESPHRAMPDVENSIKVMQLTHDIFTVSDRMWPSFND